MSWKSEFSREKKSEIGEKEKSKLLILSLLSG